MWPGRTRAPATSTSSAARVSNYGAVLDGSGIAVTTDSRDETVPDVAWNGTNFLVAYQYLSTSTDDDVRSRLVNSNAVPVGSNQIISGGGAAEQAPTVGSDGSDYLVAWQDSRSTTSGEDIYGVSWPVRQCHNRRHPHLHGAQRPERPNRGLQRPPGGLARPPCRRPTSATISMPPEWPRTARCRIRTASRSAATSGDEYTPALAHGTGNRWALDYEAANGGSTSIVHRTVAPK